MGRLKGNLSICVLLAVLSCCFLTACSSQFIAAARKAAVASSLGSASSSGAAASTSLTGLIDLAFGTSGIYTYAMTAHFYTKNIYIQPDGKLLTTGYVQGYPATGDDEVFVIRYKTDGTLDTTFNGTGVVVFQYQVGATDVGQGIFSDGSKIYVVGDSGSGMVTTTGIACLNVADGSFCAGFGVGGIALLPCDTNPNSLASRVHVEGTQGYVIGGTQDGGSQLYGTITRFNPATAALDLTFGTNGCFMLTDPAITNNLAQSFEYDTLTDKIMVSGLYLGPMMGFQYPYVAVVDVSGTGAMDAGFGTLGIATPNIAQPLNAMYYADIITLSDGRIALAGTLSNLSDEPYLAILDPVTGALDTSFNTTGYIVYDGATYWGGLASVVKRVHEQADGSLILAGEFWFTTSYDLFSMKVNLATPTVFDPTYGNAAGMSHYGSTVYNETFGGSVLYNGALYVGGYMINMGTGYVEDVGYKVR